MDDQLLTTLARFHTEVLRPDIERIVGEHVTASEGRLRADMSGHFDEIYHRLDRLQAEHHMIVVGLNRVEDQLATA